MKRAGGISAGFSIDANQSFGLQLPFEPGFLPGVGSQPGQHRLSFFGLAGAFLDFAFFVAAMLSLTMGSNDYFDFAFL